MVGDGTANSLSFAFWLQPQQFSGVALNPAFPFGLAFKLVSNHDGSGASLSRSFTHGFLLGGFPNLASRYRHDSPLQWSLEVATSKCGGLAV
ncbi:MAG: hypothetical protein ACYT04_70060, partial [Nostoc sp.]